MFADPWLASQGQQSHETSSHEGPQYQAVVLAQIGARPAGREQDMFPDPFLASQGQQSQETSSREGPEYQAVIPAQIGTRPAGREQDDPHCGIPGPSSADAMAMAAGPERLSALALPADATSDILIGML